MFGFLLKLLPFAGDLFNRSMASKDKSEDNTSAEQVAFRNAVAAEMSKPSTTWWDSFVDGINRLVRPMFTFGVLALFVWAAVEPISFSATMTALALIPENLWYILGTIVVFWFGGRVLEGLRAPTTDPAKVAEVVKTIQTIRSLEEKVPTPESPKMTAAQAADMERREVERTNSVKVLSEDEYQAEMGDTNKPLSLPAIEEWNRRRQQSK
jgi:hypothetical protein